MRLGFGLGVPAGAPPVQEHAAERLSLDLSRQWEPSGDTSSTAGVGGARPGMIDLIHAGATG